MKEELEDYKKKFQELKTECIAFWKSTHSVPLPNLCLGMGEEGPAAIEVPEQAQMRELRMRRDLRRRTHV